MNIETLKELSKFNVGQRTQICAGLELNMSVENVLLYSRLDLNPMQMKIVRDALWRGHGTVEQIKYCIDSGLSYEAMEVIILGFVRGLTIEQVSFYARPEYTANQMKQMMTGLAEKLSIKQVTLFAHSLFSADEMSKIRRKMHTTKFEDMQVEVALKLLEKTP